MKVVKPVTLTDAMIVSTTAVETVTAWNPATAYTAGDTARLASTHRIYTRLISGTTATSPDADTVNWLDTSPDNAWSMFNSEISTVTSAATTLSVVIKPGLCNSLALFGLEGTSLSVTVRDGLAGPIVYGPNVVSLDGTVISDWYQYFFEPFVQLAEVVLTDLPPYGDAHITVSITSTGTARCGILLAGTVYQLGDVRYGATAGIIDYSRKVTDEFGVTSFTRRAYSKRITANMMLANGQLNKVQRVLADLRATPCAWIATDEAGFEPLTLFGFYRDFSLEVAYPTTSYCSIEIEGLT